MKTYYNDAIHFLISHGIDPFWISTPLFIVLLYSEKGNMKRWKDIPPYMRNYHGTLIAGYVLFILLGVLHIVFGVGR